MRKRLKNILKKIKEQEKETPYNYCDRWCERCVYEKQVRCRLYGDEMEQKLNCIANGRDENDVEITGEVIRRQWEEAFEGFEEKMQEFGIEVDEINEHEEDAFKKNYRNKEKDPLRATADNYGENTDIFLRKHFFKNRKIPGEVKNELEILSWYHTVLPVKLERALTGLNKEKDQYGFGLVDAVGQLLICKKAIKKSLEALKKIRQYFPEEEQHIMKMKVLLNNISSRIDLLEKGI